MKELKPEMDKNKANILWRQSRREIGVELFRLRSSLNLTLVQLSNQTNLPTSIIDHMETGFGQFDLGSLLRLARFLRQNSECFSGGSSAGIAAEIKAPHRRGFLIMAAFLEQR